MIEVPLTRGMVALIDDEDAENILAHKWYARNGRGGHYYASRYVTIGGKEVAIHMHRYILDAPPDKVVDHINRNGLDNRRSNLRLATQSQNKANSKRQANNRTGYKGVFYHSQSGKFRAHIKRNQVQRVIGSFKTAIEAARAYDAEARLIFGEFALLNFPTEKENSND